MFEFIKFAHIIHTNDVVRRANENGLITPSAYNDFRRDPIYYYYFNL